MKDAWYDFAAGIFWAVWIPIAGPIQLVREWWQDRKRDI